MARRTPKWRKSEPPPVPESSPRHWLYEPDENPKRKHAWDRTVPGKIKVRNVVVTKCPSGVAQQEAERVLNDGIEWNPRGWARDYPERIYVVRGGWVYRATPTVPGRSYHAFPELLSRLPPDRDLRKKLVELAKRESEESEKRVREWLRQ